MEKKRRSLGERIMKTIPVYGDRMQLEHLRDWDKQARLLIQKELNDSLHHTKPMLKTSVEQDIVDDVKEMEEIRRLLNELRQMIKSAPAPYSPTFTSMKKVGAEEIQKVIDLDESVYEMAQEISALMEQASERYRDNAEEGKAVAQGIYVKARDIRRIYTQRHAVITRPREQGKPPYD